MAVTVESEVKNPLSVRVAITIEMSLLEWQKVHAVLGTADGAGGEPFWTLRYEIKQQIDKVSTGLNAHARLELDAVSA